MKRVYNFMAKGWVFYPLLKEFIILPFYKKGLLFYDQEFIILHCEKRRIANPGPYHNFLETLEGFMPMF